MSESLARLGVSADRLAALEAEAEAERERRDRLIVQALTDGCAYREVARAARLSPARVAAIVGETHGAPPL